MHSCGGIPGSEATKGFTKEDRPNGASIVHLIYLSAFALAENVFALDAIGNQPLPWWETIEEKQYRPIKPEDVLFNDVSRERASELTTQLKDHSAGVFTSKITYAGWKHIDSTYIICKRDQAVVPEVQEYLATQPGNRITIDGVDAGHLLYMAKPDETTDAVHRAVGERV